MLKRFFVTVSTAFACLAPFALNATEYRLGDVRVAHAWSRPAPAVAVTGAAYFTLSTQRGSDRLIAAASPIAKRVELHEHVMRDGIMSMRPVAGVSIVPQRPTLFEPGGLHVMLMGLREPLTKGKTFPLTLTFEKAGSLDIVVSVEEPEAAHTGHSKHEHN